MDIIKYNESVQKIYCPKSCSLKNNLNTKPVVVNVPSNRVIGILISRDPTYSWYQCVFNQNKNPFKEGVPGKLVKKINIFMESKLSDQEKELMEKVLYKNIYWTHLHKCFTKSNDKKIPKFKKNNAKYCANKWLSRELVTVIKQYNIKFIIALGKDVQKWIKKWQKNNDCLLNGIEIIELLHTSDQNNEIWYRSAIKIIENTEKSLKILSGLCVEKD